MKRRVNWKRFFQMCVLCAASCTAATPNHVGLVFLSAPGAPFSRFSIHCIHRNTMHFYTPNFHADGKFCSHSIRSTWIFTFFIPFNCILGSRARVTDAYIRWKKNIYIALKSLLFTAIWISEWRALWSSVTNGGERCYMLSRCQRIHYIVLFLFILFAVCGNARCSLPFEVLNAGGAFLYRQQFRWLFSSILFAATQMLFFYLLMAFDKYWFDRFIFGVFPDVAIVGCVKACGMVNKSIIGDR